MSFFTLQRIDQSTSVQIDWSIRHSVHEIDSIRIVIDEEESHVRYIFRQNLLWPKAALLVSVKSRPRLVPSVCQTTEGDNAVIELLNLYRVGMVYGNVCPELQGGDDVKRRAS